jgi:cytochrome c biogenesis protein CcmG/thiol:disulfide interchange protein DsbE
MGNPNFCLNLIHKHALRLASAIVLSLAFLASQTYADETLPVLEVGSDTYSNVLVTSVSVTDIYFTSEKGMANAKLKDLDPEMQKHFNYDPAKADAVEKKQAADKFQYHLQLLKEPPPRTVADEPAEHDSAEQAAPGKKLWAKSFLNQKAPDLVVEKWLTDQPDLRGKCVLIDFWATWCPPCRAAIAELNAYSKQFGDKLVVIGISDETEEAVRRMVDPKIEYYVAIDTQARMKKAVEVTGIPHVLIIDPQGYVRWEGFPFLDGYELNAKVVADIINRYSN